MPRSALLPLLLLVACTPTEQPSPPRAPVDPTSPTTDSEPPPTTDSEPPTDPTDTEPLVVDVLAPAPPATTDLLFVIDSSHSMSCETECHASIAEELPANLDPLLAALDAFAVDWHLGVITTDMVDPERSGQLVDAGGTPWVDGTTADPTAAFGAAIANVGILGSVEERGMDAIQAAIDVNAGFFRDGSALHTVVMSNEPDVSVVSPDAFTAWYGGLRSAPLDRSLSAMVCTSLTNTDDHCKASRVSLGTEWTDASAALGGDQWHLVQPDWAAVMTELAELVTRPSPTYPLSQTPLEDTLAVVWTDEALVDTELVRDDDGCEGPGAGDWVYDAVANAITLCVLVPSRASTVTVTYDRG